MKPQTGFRIRSIYTASCNTILIRIYAIIYQMHVERKCERCTFFGFFFRTNNIIIVIINLKQFISTNFSIIVYQYLYIDICISFQQKMKRERIWWKRIYIERERKDDYIAHISMVYQRHTHNMILNWCLWFSPHTKSSTSSLSSISPYVLKWWSWSW